MTELMYRDISFGIYLRVVFILLWGLTASYDFKCHAFVNFLKKYIFINLNNIYLKINDALNYRYKYPYNWNVTIVIIFFVAVARAHTGANGTEGISYIKCHCRG